MKKHHVYGLGNALVDIEVEVTPSFLQEMKVDKGLMTLVDEERQAELLSGLDNEQHKRSCGGSAANTMIAIAQLGGKAFYSCKVANDEAGDFYYRDLVEAGVSSNIGSERESGVTGKCLVLITPDADRTMNSHLGITETMSENEIVWEELKNSEYLYLEGYLSTSPSGRAACIKAREVAQEHKVKTALTFSDPGIVAHFKDQLDLMMGEKIDLLFCNESEAYAYTDTDNIEEAVEKLKKRANAFAITQGPKGAYLYDGSKEIVIVVPKVVKAVDTNGAGDIFAGAFLYAITQGKSYAEAGALACSAASELVAHFGARLHKDQILKVKERILN